MNMKTILLAGAVSAVASTAAMADGHACEIGARVSIVGNEFPAIQTIGAGAMACTGGEVSTNLTSEHQTINVAGMSGNPAEYTSAIIANSSIVALMNEELLRPLDALIAEHGEGLSSNQLITVDGEVMAVAFMANAQHLVYRSDVLEQVGLEAPATYEEMLTTAEAIREAGIMENPIGGAFASGWNLAQEFNNMFLGFDGQFFEPGSATPTVNSEAGVQALEMMLALSEYMNPDFLTHDSNATSAEFRAGNMAMMNMWGSRAAVMLDVEGVPQEVLDGFAMGAPMTVGGGTTPASTLWWDGFTVAANISDEEAEATFIALMNAIRPSILEDADVAAQAVWLIPGYEPTESAAGVFAAATSGTVAYPMLPYMGLMHSALGAELSDFMQGNESAEQALADVEAAYTAAARESGFLN